MDRHKPVDYTAFTQTMPQCKYDKPTRSHTEVQGSCPAHIHSAVDSALPSKCCCPRVEDQISHILSPSLGSKIQVHGRARLLCQEDAQLVLFCLGVGCWGTFLAMMEPPFPKPASEKFLGAGWALHLPQQPMGRCVAGRAVAGRAQPWQPPTQCPYAAQAWH